MFSSIKVSFKVSLLGANTGSVTQVQRYMYYSLGNCVHGITGVLWGLHFYNGVFQRLTMLSRTNAAQSSER